MTAERTSVPGPAGEIDALWLAPEPTRAVLVYAHGAGAGMTHAFMEKSAAVLAAGGIATLRYQFPYMQAGKKRPDRAPRLEATVRAAAAWAADRAGGVPLLAGGKSMGGRMTSRAAAAEPLPGVAGLVLVGFPLHPAGKPGTERAAHLAQVTIPMLFLQGTRDRLADLDLLEPVLSPLPRARLHVVDGADHSFHVLKRSGRTDEDVLGELGDAIAAFAGACG